MPSYDGIVFFNYNTAARASSTNFPLYPYFGGSAKRICLFKEQYGKFPRLSFGRGAKGTRKSVFRKKEKNFLKTV